MRKSTLITASFATLSAIAIAQNVAIENQPVVLVLQPTDANVSASDKKPNSPSDQTPSSVPDKPLESAETSTPPDQTTTPEETGSADQTPKPAAARVDPGLTESTQPAPAEAVAAVEKTVSSDTVEYQYGIIQLGLTSVDGAITDVQVLQGDTGYGRGETYSALISATIQAQGTNFGNYSGATFTTEAFRSAVANALGKL